MKRSAMILAFFAALAAAEAGVVFAATGPENTERRSIVSVERKIEARRQGGKRFARKAAQGGRKRKNFHYDNNKSSPEPGCPSLVRVEAAA